MTKQSLWIVAGVGILALVAYSYFKGKNTSSKQIYSATPSTYIPFGVDTPVYFEGTGHSRVDTVLIRQTGRTIRQSNKLDFFGGVLGNVSTLAKDISSAYTPPKISISTPVNLVRTGKALISAVKNRNLIKENTTSNNLTPIKSAIPTGINRSFLLSKRFILNNN